MAGSSFRVARMNGDALWVAGLIVFGFMLGQLIAVYRTRRDFWLLDHLTRSQLDSAERQLAQQLAADELRRLIERRERSYGDLSRWLVDLERTVDEVHRLVLSDDPANASRARAILDVWPWETLRVPSYAAWGDLHWSDEVRSEIRRFSAVSAGFVMHALSHLHQVGESSKVVDSRLSGDQLVADSNELYGVMAAIRSCARRDLAKLSASAG